MSAREISQAAEIVPDRLYYVALRQCPRQTPHAHFFTVDNTLVYWNFFLDFGPLSLGQLYQFCQILNMKLQDPALRSKKIFFYSSHHPHKRANAAVLMACYAVIYLGRTPEEAYRPFESTAPKFTPFHDASQFACTFNLTVMDCCKAVYKAKQCKLFDFDTFDLREYIYYEQVENGDLNWILPNMCAFAGPQETREAGLLDGYSTLVPEDYLEYFKQRNVRCIMRLNKKYYNAERFEKHGIHVVDLHYRDGSVPPMSLLQTFLRGCEESTVNIGVHCKAGLGRTGTCMGAYIQKHYGFTAAEVIAWIRICRPGSIIGPQQHFLEEVQEQMFREGDEYRRRIAAGESRSGGATSGSASLPDALSGLAVKGEDEEEGGAASPPRAVRTEFVADEHDRSNQASELLAARHSPTAGSPLGGRGGR